MLTQDPPIVDLVSAASRAKAGGVVSHLQDLAAGLRDAGVRCAVFSPRDVARRLVRRAGRASLRASAVHFHVSAPRGLRLLLLWLLAALCPAERILLTFHHGGVEKHYNSAAGRGLLRLLFARVDTVIALNGEQARFFGDFAVSIVPASSFVRGTIDTDVPPAEPTTRPGAERDRRYRVATSGMELPLYGFEELVDACARLDREVTLEVYTYARLDDALMNAVQRRAAAVGVDVVHRRSLERDDFLRALRQADVYVRNSAADSCGLAVFEAVALGLRTAATDVCARPAATTVYARRGADTVAAAIRRALDASPPGPDAREALGRLARENLDVYLDAYGLPIPAHRPEAA